MPNHDSWSANFSATSTRAARVLLECGVMSVSSTSHSTSTLLPPRIGSGQLKTGLSTRSEEEPSAWLVLDPSKPQVGSSSPSARILVFERSLAVGLVPSIQMYSALKLIGGVLEKGGAAAQQESQVAISQLLPVCEQDVTYVRLCR